MSVYLTPSFGAGYQGMTSAGMPNSGGMLYTYLAGTTTPSSTYTTAAANIFNPNPIVLDASGRIPNSAEMWQTGGVAIKVVVKDSAGNTLQTQDNLQGTNDPFFYAFNPGTSGYIPVSDGTQLVPTAPDPGVLNLLGKQAPIVTSITALRARVKTANPWVLATGYYAGGDGGGGLYYYVASDTTSSDNGGTIIVGADGGRWYLVLQSPVNAKQFGAKFDGSNNDTASINAAIAWLISVGGGELVLPQGTAIVSGTGLQGASNGAAIIINTSNNAAAAPIKIRGAGSGKTTLKIANTNYYNVMEIVNLGAGVTAMPVTLDGITLDGNGANQTQQVAGDRYQNGIYMERVTGVLTRDLTCQSASYHGCDLNAIQQCDIEITTVGNYGDGALFTGNSGSGAGFSNKYTVKSFNNGIVQVGQLDTIYAGVLALYQTGCQIKAVTTGHVRGPAFRCQYLTGCEVNLTSYGDTGNGCALDQATIGNHFVLNIQGSGTAVKDINITGGQVISDNVFDVVLKDNLGPHLQAGQNGQAFKNNLIRGIFQNITSPGSGALIQTGANFSNNVINGFVAGDERGGSNVNYFLNGPTGGANLIANGQFIGTFTTAPFNGLTNTDNLRAVTGYAPANQSILASTWGASPQTSPKQSFDCLVIITSIGSGAGITGLSYGAGGFNIPQTLNSNFFLRAGQTFNVSWTGVAPTFEFVAAQ